MIKRLCLFIAVVSAMAGAVCAADVLPVQGPVILARNGEQATYLWDASQYVSALVKARRFGDDGLHAIEATGISALANKAAESSARTLILKVVYTKSGAVSPVYGVSTFIGVENVFTMTVSRADLVKNGAAWAQSAANGSPPPQIKIDVTGQLPPPQ
jgi:hypothetical protein